MFAGIVADELHLLWVVIDRFVYDHDVAFGCTVFKIRCGVHADVDHALGHFLIQLLRNFFRTEIIPAAFDGRRIIYDAGLSAGVFLGQWLAGQTGDKKDARADGTGEKCDGKHNTNAALCLLGMILICFVHRNNSFVF